MAALVAAVAVLFMIPGLDSLRQVQFPNTYGMFEQPGAEAIELPASSLDPGTALLVALLPGLWILGVYAIAQRTWPRVAGPVRDLLPPVLTRVAAVIGVAALAAIALAWTAPGAAPLHLRYNSDTSTLGSFSAGVHPGTEVAPWLLLTLVMLAVAAAVVTVLVARRPALSGLTAEEDLGIRRIAVHRVLRTAAAGALVVLVFSVVGWADGTLQAATREAYGSLDAMATAYADGVTTDADGVTHLQFPEPPPMDLPPGLYTLAFGTPVAAALGLLVLVLWSPRGVKEQVHA